MNRNLLNIDEPDKFADEKIDIFPIKKYKGGIQQEQVFRKSNLEEEKISDAALN